jgi:hypothetical protein
MSDYTPTTVEVGDAYDSFMIEFKNDYTGDNQFDRWLAEHDAEVAKAERERIVVLLNGFRERLYDDANDSDDPAWDIERAEAVETCITLIKGEN